MPKFVAKGLNKLQHAAPIKPQHSPAKHTILTYGAKIQYTNNTNEIQLTLPEQIIKYMQKVVGITSYYDAALDNTALMALNDLAAAQAVAKQLT